MSSSSQPISSQPAAVGTGGSQGPASTSQRRSSSFTSTATKKTSKTPRDKSNHATSGAPRTSVVESGHDHPCQAPLVADPSPAHPCSFSGGRSLLPPAPNRSSTSAASTPRVPPASTQPVSVVDIGALLCSSSGDFRTSRSTRYTTFRWHSCRFRASQTQPSGVFFVKHYSFGRVVSILRCFFLFSVEFELIECRRQK